jgi:hypothetical protein
VTPTVTVTPTNTPTVTPTNTPTNTPTPSPSPVVNCRTGIVEVGPFDYYDCCGLYISGNNESPALTCYDANLPFSNITDQGSSCTVSCVTPTPTPTNTVTPTNTPTNTPTLTPTNTPTNTPTPSPTCFQYRLANDGGTTIQFTFTPCCGEPETSPYSLPPLTTIVVCSSTLPTAISGSATLLGVCPSC